MKGIAAKLPGSFVYVRVQVCKSLQSTLARSLDYACRQANVSDSSSSVTPSP